MKEILLLCCILLGLSANAQILNAESLRKVTDTSGFSGNMGANFALKRNVNDFLVISTDVHVQYKKDPHLVILRNDVNFQKIDESKFANSGITHLRYNYRFRPRIAWEVFLQGQYNKVNLINFRGLVGTGPRFKLSKSEKYKFYLGVLSMLEYEEVTDGVTALQRDIRGSSYFSFSLYPTKNISIISTTYYQPVWSEFGDYRISSQSSMAIGLFLNFALKINYTFTFDTFPAVGIRKSQYDFSTGITYSFD